MDAAQREKRLEKWIASHGDAVLRICYLTFLDILRLPEKYRQVLTLYYYQDMTLEETASALGLSRSTAHHRLRRAEAALRDQLTGGDGGEE